jgi:MFS transporter, FHS family, L-fucose permease
MTKLKSTVYPLVIIGILFFVFGFITWINGILIPYFQICLELSNFQATLVAFAAYIAYFVMAIPSAWVLGFTGYKKGMVLGLFIMALGTVIFIPAAYARTYAVFLTGLFITGTGLALLQTAANPYIAILGPIESTAQRIGFMGLANKVAGIIGITVLGSVFLLNADSVIDTVSRANAVAKAKILDEYVLKVVTPYSIITVILVLLGIMIYFSKLPEISETNKTVDDDLITNAEPKKNIFQYPHLILGVIALFFASACEVLPIDGIVLYSREVGIPISVSRHFATYTLVAMLVGYLATTIFIPKYFSQQKALQFCAVWGLALTISSFFLTGLASIYCMMLMGFGGAMLWGTIWGLSLKGLGNFTKLGSALLLMSVIGGGIFPVLYGKLLDMNKLHPQNATLMLVPCYLIVLFFAVKGYRINSWKPGLHKESNTLKSIS